MNDMISQHNTLPSSKVPKNGAGHLKKELSPEAYAELMGMFCQKRPEMVTIANVEGNVIADETSDVPFPIDISYDYFNLFVIDGEKLRSLHFQMSPERCLCEEYATERPVARWLKPLTRKEIAEIMKFPTIVANKTRRYNGEVDPTQKFHYGHLTDIDVQHGIIYFSFRMSDSIDQSLLESLVHDLHIVTRPRTSELAEIHWSVKNADLITTLSRHVKLSNPKKLKENEYYGQGERN